jgi:branched-chain amino acid transport system permease protein
MRSRRKLGLWLTLGVTAAIGVWPVILNRAATREAVFTMLMSVALASSLNILLGYTGYVSFGHIVFFGLGGYTGFYLLATYRVSLYPAMVAGGLVAGALALVLGEAILHLRGAYFALATIGVNEAARAFVNNFEPFGGPVGMSLNFQTYQDYGGAEQALWTTYILMVVLTLVVIVVSYLVRRSKFGLGLMAIRENQDAAEVMGVVAPGAKTWAYVLSAIFPGIAGVLFFFKNGNVEPGDAFRLHLSIETLVMVMLGGQGTVLGPVLGALGYQWLRGALLVSPVFRNIQLAVAGSVLLVIVLFVPAGVVGWLRQRVRPLRGLLE